VLKGSQGKPGAGAKRRGKRATPLTQAKTKSGERRACRCGERRREKSLGGGEKTMVYRTLKIQLETQVFISAFTDIIQN